MLSQATIEEKYKENIKEKMTGKSTADNFYLLYFQGRIKQMGW